MPRPRTVADEQVLDAVIEVIGRVGPANVTFARVAQEVGLSSATLVQRFGSKREMLLAVARRGSVEMSGVLKPAAGCGSPLEALIAGLCDLTSMVRSPETLANHLTFLQIDLSDPEFHVLTLTGARRLRGSVAGLVQDAVATGELRPCDTGRLASAVQTTYNGALLTWAIYRDGSIEGFLREQLEFLLAPWRANAV